MFNQYSKLASELLEKMDFKKIPVMNFAQLLYRSGLKRDENISFETLSDYICNILTGNVKHDTHVDINDLFKFGD